MSRTPELSALAQQLRRVATMLDSHGEHTRRHLSEVRGGAVMRAAGDTDRVSSGASDGPDHAALAAAEARAEADWGRWSFAVGALIQGAGIAEEFLARHDPRPSSRPSATEGACLGCWTHAPDSDGRLCTRCRKPWPCRPGETESWVEDCTGTIDPVTHRCRTCELSGDSLVCRDCGEVKDRADGRSGICGGCRKRRTRHLEVV